MRFPGKGGAFYVDMPGAGAAPTPVGNIKDWTHDRSVAQIDATAMGDGNKAYVADLPDSKGAYSGFLDDSASDLYAAASDGLARKFYLYAKTVAPMLYWYGLATFSQAQSGGVGKAGEIAGTWTAAGNITRVPA